MVIRNYFQQMHPHVSIRWLKQHIAINLNLGYILTRTITWAKDTRRLRRLLWRLDFAQVGADQLWRPDQTKPVCPGGEEMAGEPTPKVLVVFCSMLWKEGPRLLGGQRGDAEATDLTGAGGSLQVWTKQKNSAFTITSNRVAGAINILFLTLASPRQVFNLFFSLDNSHLHHLQKAQF